MAELVEMVVESVRVHMPSSQHVVILKELDRERYLPIWIGPVGSERHRDEAPGRVVRAAADPRPVRDDPRRARRGRPAGGHLVAGRGDVPRPPVPRVGGARGRGRFAPVGRARAGGPGRRPDLRRRTRSSSGPGSGRTTPPARSRGSSRPTTRPPWPIPGWPSSASSSTRSTWAATPGPAKARTGRSDRAGTVHRRPSLIEDRLAAGQGPLARRPQAEAEQPEVADRPQDHLRLRPGRRAGRPRVVGHADLDDRPARRAA